VKFHDNYSMSIAEILLFIKKDGRKLPSPIDIEIEIEQGLTQ